MDSQSPKEVLRSVKYILDLERKKYNNGIDSIRKYSINVLEICIAADNLIFKAAGRDNNPKLVKKSMELESALLAEMRALETVYKEFSVEDKNITFLVKDVIIRGMDALKRLKSFGVSAEELNELRSQKRINLAYGPYVKKADLSSIRMQKTPGLGVR